MTSNDDLDRRLTAWLDGEAAPYAPHGLSETVAGSVADARRLPGWATTERWISMETQARFGAVPRVLLVLLAFGLLTALTAGTIAIGSAVTGPVANGLIVYPHESGALWTVDADGSDPQPLVEADARLEHPSWSPDGTKLAYWSYTTGSFTVDLMVSAADGSDPVTVASGVRSVTGWMPPSWSPDGTSLAFSATDTPGSVTATCASRNGSFCNSRIFVASADGTTGAVQVGDPELDARSPSWSPDGTSIAFGAGDSAQDVRLHLMDPDGSNVRQISDVVGEDWALLRIGWSSDGTALVGTSGLGDWDIWEFPLDGGDAANVSAVEGVSGADQLFPAYAPDGAIAWFRGGPPLCDCMAFRERDAEPVELSDYTMSPTWSPDGRFLIAQPKDDESILDILDRTGAVQATIEDVGDASYGASWKAGD